MTTEILIVEDDFANQQVARLFLKKFGYESEIVENGEKAVEATKHKKYSLIFMDCQMPVMDGFTATRSIRVTQGVNQNTPIIALTANLVNGINQQCRSSGMDDVICKPISMQGLKDITEKWIGKQSLVPY